MCSIFEGKQYPFCANHARAANMVNVALTARSGGELVRQAVTENGCRRWSASGHSGFSFRPAKTTIAKTTWSI